MPGGGCRAGRMASAGRCAYFYRLARPLPLGAGDYVRSAVIGSACGEGVGVSSRFSLSRCSSSCHLVAPVVIASLCLLRRPVLVVPCSHRFRLPCSVLISCRLVLPLVSSCLVAPPRSFVLPVSQQALAGSASARSCLLAIVPRRACGGWCRRAGVGGDGLLLGGAACRRVVFGLWCRCLYI